MESILRVGRGTVVISTRADPVERPVREIPRDLANETLMSTDNQSQATLIIRDPQRSSKLIASLTLKPNTNLRLRTALQPRFDWSSTNYVVDLRDLLGEVDIFVTNRLPRGFQLDIYTPEGAWVSLNRSGQYVVSATNNQVRVINRDGEVILFAPNTDINRSIPPATQASLAYGNSEIVLSPSFVELLTNPTFEDVLPPENLGNNLPVGWACTNSQNQLPRGSYRSEIYDGRLALRLVRGEGASSHGETRCVQPFQPAQVGLDIRNYNYLALRTTFFVKYQSLNACGERGSECPLMLRMDYRDVDGNDNKWWIHGFYSKDDPQSSAPLSCDTCRENHDSIYSNAWYTFESGNILTLFPPNEPKPGWILNVTFYASGHQYDVFVSEVSLLAGNVQNGSPSS
jgi:hypothetical protein